MSSWTTEQALAYWVEKKLLTQQKAAELQSALQGAYADKHGVPRAVAIFATIGAILVGLGVLLFIGSNWADMSPVLRVAVLFLAYAVVLAGAFVTEQRGWDRTSESLWFLADIVFGANIFLLAQIFHYSLTYWQGPFLWMAGTVAMGYARQHVVHGYLVVPLAIFTLGWLDAGGGRLFGGAFDFLGNEAGLMPLISLIGMGLVSIGLLTRGSRHAAFLAPASMAWGMLLVLLPLIISTIDDSIPREMFNMRGTLKQWLIVGGSLLLVAAALWRGDMKRPEPKVFILVLTLFCAALVLRTATGSSAVAVLIDYNPLYYFLYILVIFLLSLWTVWIAMLTENAKLLNLGMLSVSLIVIIQYFSWSFLLLDRSLAFILGGILLITMTILIERKRRNILSSFKE